MYSSREKQAAALVVTGQNTMPCSDSDSDSEQRPHIRISDVTVVHDPSTQVSVTGASNWSHPVSVVKVFAL